MKIVLLAPLPPEQNGIADYAANFASALEGEGIEVLRPFAGMPVTADPAEIRARLEALSWHGVELAHAELGGGRVREFIALELLRQLKPSMPLTATAHDPERLIWRAAKLPPALAWTQRLPQPMAKLASVLGDPATLAQERRLAHGLARIVALTDTGAQALCARMQLPHERVAVIAHGHPVIAPAPLPAGALRLLYFGFIYPGKGIEDLIAAFALLRARDARAASLRLTLAGGTAPELTFGRDASYLDQLRKLIWRHGLEEIVDWQIDIDASEIPALVQAHHAMVLPYRESRKLRLLGRVRGTSGALAWAIACGRGAIASSARAFAEEVGHGNGVVFREGDVAALAAAITRLLDEPFLAADWAAHAQRLSRQRTWPVIARRFHELFETLAEEELHAA